MKQSVAGTKIIPQKKPRKVSWLKMDEEEKVTKQNNKTIKCMKIAQKSIYVLVLIILTFILLVQIYNCLAHWQNEPTYVETRIAPQHKALFPAMTICPVTAGYKEAVIKVMLIYSYF